MKSQSLERRWGTVRIEMTVETSHGSLTEFQIQFRPVESEHLISMGSVWRGFVWNQRHEHSLPEVSAGCRLEALTAVNSHYSKGCVLSYPFSAYSRRDLSDAPRIDITLPYNRHTTVKVSLS